MLRAPIWVMSPDSASQPRWGAAPAPWGGGGEQRGGGGGGGGGRGGKRVRLRRGAAATIEELLLAAEYVMNEGNYEVVLCERGIRGFGNYTRYTLDLSAVPVLKHLTHLPVIVDPSHATGKWRYVESLALAAVAGGADGLLVEVHPDPERALSDGPQSLNLENFNRMMARLRAVAQAVGRGL